MPDFELRRRNMVDCQIRTKDITDPRVIRAFSQVPREKFVPASQVERAYVDDDVRITSGEPARYLTEPVVLAGLMQMAEVRSGDVVLDVGCASGYSCALLSSIATSVVAVEEDEKLVELATATLQDLGYDNAVVLAGPLAKGYAKEAPYDVVFIGGAVDAVPQTLFDQLRDGGRLVCVEGQGLSGEAKIYLRDGDVVSGRPEFNAAVKPLPGFAREAAFVF